MSKSVKTILDNFNFTKVLVAMNALGWRWTGVPVMTEAVLRKEAERLLTRVESGESTYIATGGFVAALHGGVRLELSFCVSTYDCQIAKAREPKLTTTEESR